MQKPSFTKINAHIEEYLDYYCCDLSQSPGFAVLLKGQWGSKIDIDWLKSYKESVFLQHPCDYDIFIL